MMANNEIDDEDKVMEDKMLEESIEVEAAEEEVGEEEAEVKVVMSPVRPSKYEKEKHEVTHVPFRSWCPVFVAGRGIKSPHKLTKKREEEELPRFAMDYGFLGQEDQASAVLLAVRELKSGMMFSMIVPKKGVCEKWIETRIANWMNGFGFKKMLFRSDNENSILSLRKKIVALVDHQVLEEDAIKGESQTNGLAEVGIRIVEGIVRTLKIAVEEKMKMAIDNKSILLAWLVEHACVVYNRCTMMSDGRTPW